MNVELLQQIKARILAEPDAFRMDTWSCGTAHCIGGWALTLNGFTVVNPRQHPTMQRLADGRFAGAVAAEMLELRDGADRLFMVSSWPYEFAHSYCNAESRTECARVAADRIDRFVATNGAE